jgi:Ca2+-binding RTX toxin-like protein
MQTKPPSSTLDITGGGETAVTLSQDLVNALGVLQVEVKGFGSTDISDGIAEFEIIGGAANLNSAKVDIIHQGGLTFKSANTTVDLTDFIINNLGDRNVLTGLVTINDNLITRAPLFDLQGGKVVPSEVNGSFNLEFEDVGVSLTENASNVLNQAFQVNNFAAGLNIGIANIDARLTDPKQTSLLPEMTLMSSQPFTLIGTESNDLLAGIAGRDNIIFGLDGNDTINTLFSGNDRIDGGDGDDSIISGAGDDIIEGGSGNDFINSGSGNNRVNGGEGNDFIISEEGANEIRGGDGDDRIGGGAGPSRLFGDDGNDNVFGSFADDILSGGSGDDVVSGFTGNDQVFGDDGNDRLNGDQGNDSLFGGFGNDILIGTDTFTPQSLVGLGEIDILKGEQGRDTFVLGTVLKDGTELIFYNDGNPNTPGINDYGLIADFDSFNNSSNTFDVIQLSGSINKYVLGASPNGLPEGTGIFLNDGVTPELIGIVANVSQNDLSLSNVNQFTFV